MINQVSYLQFGFFVRFFLQMFFKGEFNVLLFDDVLQDVIVCWNQVLEAIFGPDDKYDFQNLDSG